MYDSLSHLSEENDHFVFVNGVIDGLGSDSSFVSDNLCAFLLGNQSAPCVTDANHNMKNLHYQIIGRNSAVICSVTLINPSHLQSANIAEPLFRVTDWASDKVVLQLASHDTVESLKWHLVALTSLSEVRDDELMSILALVYSLYFIRLHLFCVNSINLAADSRIYGLWSSVIWFTSLDNLSDITKKNIVLETVGLIFIISRDDVCHPRKTTSMPLEHQFGDICGTRCEFTVSEYEKVECAQEAIASGDLNAS